MGFSFALILTALLKNAIISNSYFGIELGQRCYYFYRKDKKSYGSKEKFIDARRVEKI